MLKISPAEIGKYARNNHCAKKTLASVKTNLTTGTLENIYKNLDDYTIKLNDSTITHYAKKLASANKEDVFSTEKATEILTDEASNYSKKDLINLMKNGTPFMSKNTLIGLAKAIIAKN